MSLKLLPQQLIDWVDRYLDKITSYRLLLYYLITIITWAIFLSLTSKEIPYHWSEILLSAAWLVIICRTVNLTIARYLDIPKNVESDLITALILTLILSPASSLKDYIILAAAGLLAMASKYVLVWRRKHIFNPAALGAFSVALLFSYFPSWWVSLTAITPVVAIGGFLILRKMKRFIMVLTFIGLYMLYLFIRLIDDSSLNQTAHTIWLSLISTPLLFFGIVMLTEPQTSPLSLAKQVAYGALVSILYAGGIFKLSPEKALLIGNLFSFLISPNPRFKLSFAGTRQEAQGISSFIFKSKNKPKFLPGQYMEWTIPKSKSDSRGNRRYLTISSSPTEDNLMITIRLPAKSSSFKDRLSKLKKNDNILASQVTGSFILPSNVDQKLVFIAGGIGVTPFRSIIKYLIDTGESRPITLLYAASSPHDFAFTDLFKSAESIGVKSVYTATDTELTPREWSGEKGAINAAMIRKVIPDYKQRLFYLSGPYGFVQTVRLVLLKMGIARQQITVDYFPGYG